MAKIGFGKSAGWVSIILFSRLLTVISQTGFLSIDCGGKTNHTDDINIRWVPDANYIDVGQTVNTGNTSLPSYLQSLRYFPKPLNKSCYQLPVAPKVPHLLRFWFAFGNYTPFPQLPIRFAFSIETPGLLTVRNLTIPDSNPVHGERIFVSSGSVLYICLIRTSQTDFPFINAIELRPLQHGMYPQAKPGRMLNPQSRVDVGGNFSVLRYPQDKFDRLWQSDTTLSSSGGEKLIQKLNLQETISNNNTVDLPPTTVMQTAWSIPNNSFTLNLNLDGTGKGGNKSLLLLYFAEIDPLNKIGIRSFDVIITNVQPDETITIVRNYSASELQLQLNVTNYVLTFGKANNSSYGPILNALENYVIVDTEPATYIEDINAVDAIKKRFNIKSWISDPCFVIRWDGIGCDNNFSVIRISEINLSGMNLTGSLPESIGQLTALVNVSLDNNNLTGPFPNFSNLTMLERLHLQSNSLNGSVPEWLAGLKNLKELFIDNNNFSGVISAHLLKPSLTFRHSGNRYLSLPLNTSDLYPPSNSNKNRVKLIVGITISGSLVVIALLLIAGVLVHRKKARRKESSKLEKQSKHAVDEDSSMIIMPDTTKSRAFTLEEIKTATQNFSQKIGEGGFGSVFFGKLPDRTNIAVKVLSMFSKQGVHEFLNEVDLLSKVHHKNLVSLLGYCIESRELMLVYDHMSGGSLRHHLYGPTAELCQLNWKTRLKIAVDAAQGLEYLHVGCTPKIIHRDIKTANILLDTNFNGKLADFGLSRKTIDGEASHITTTVKGTFGYLDPEYMTQLFAIFLTLKQLNQLLIAEVISFCLRWFANLFMGRFHRYFSTQMLTEKSDVYSFGVVLLEIICGRQPINAKLTAEQLNLIRWVTPYVEMDENPGKIAEIIDKRLGKNYDIESISNVAKLAIRCVQTEPSSRPHVSEVVAELKETIKLEKNKASLVSEIDIEYDDLSFASSGPKTMESAESSSSKLTAVPQEGQ